MKTNKYPENAELLKATFTLQRKPWICFWNFKKDTIAKFCTKIHFSMETVGMTGGLTLLWTKDKYAHKVTARENS